MTPENMPAVAAENNTPVAYKGVPVMTTDMLALGYGVTSKQITDNFTNNKTRYVEGDDYILLSGAELRGFKNLPENFGVVDPKASRVYLWTERGARRHCKSIGTDQAWAQFDEMADTYFAVKQGAAITAANTREVKQVFSDYHGIARLIGLDKNQAALAANNATVKICGVNPLEQIGVTHLLAPQQEAHLTATQVAEQLGLRSAQSANKKMEEFGYQVRELHSDSGWKPTPKGERFAVWLDTGRRHNGGSPVRQLRWSAGVVATLRSEMGEV